VARIFDKGLRDRVMSSRRRNFGNEPYAVSRTITA
jgi:hypothetical protein